MACRESCASSIASRCPSSFFIPAASAVLHPKVITDIQGAKQKHEIGVHGWIHERLPLLNDEKEEQRMLNLSIDTLTKMTGKRPIGYRAPSWKFSKWTMGQVKAAGFLYDSSLMASDDAYELLLDGKPTGVVELPIERILDDAPYFGGNADGSNPSVGDVYEVFQSEFDVAYEEGGLYLLTMHPHMMGHRSRAAMLERLIRVHEEEARRVVRDARADRHAREALDRQISDPSAIAAAACRACPTPMRREIFSLSAAISRPPLSPLVMITTP